MRIAISDMHIPFSENTRELLCLLDSAGTFQHVWKSGFNITGYADEEFLGKSLDQFVHQQDIKLLDRIYDYNVVSCTANFSPTELRFKHKKGFYVWMELSLKPIIYAEAPVLLASWIDISEKVRLKNHLLQINAVFLNLKRIVNQSALVMIADLDGKIVDCNKAFCKAAQYRMEELRGVDCTLLNTDLRSHRFRIPVLRLIRSGKIWKGELKNTAHDGSVFWTLTSIAPVYSTKGRIYQYCSISHLITERKEFEEKLVIANAHRQRQNHRLNEFSYITSHNIRGPIATMKGLLNISENMEDEKQALQILDKMKVVVQKLDETVNDLNMIFAVNNEEHHRELIDLNELLEEVLLLYRNEILKTSASVLYDFDKCPVIYSVRKCWKSIFENLLSNSLKYAKHDTAPEIIIRCDANDSNLKITFSDNGLGVDLKYQRAKLFSLYKRFHEHVQGKGIGLYLIRTQVELLGGTIDVESEPGKGTSFILKFSLCVSNGYVRNFVGMP